MYAIFFACESMCTCVQHFAVEKKLLFNVSLKYIVYDSQVRLASQDCVLRWPAKNLSQMLTDELWNCSISCRPALSIFFLFTFIFCIHIEKIII